MLQCKWLLQPSAGTLALKSTFSFTGANIPTFSAESSAGPSKDHKTHKISMLLFKISSIHKGRGVGEDKSRHSCFLLKISPFFTNHYRKPQPVSGQSFLLPPKNFAPPPQSSPLLSDPSKLPVGGLAVLP